MRTGCMRTCRVPADATDHAIRARLRRSSRARSQLVGLDRSNSARHDEVTAMLVRHCHDLRRHDAYRDAVILLIVEANMSYLDADRVANLFQQVASPVHVLSRDQNRARRPGIWTGAVEKELYVNSLVNVLRMKGLGRTASLLGSHPETDWHLLLTQLSMFRRETRSPTDPRFGRFVTTFSGKAGAGQRDDLAMALQMAVHWGMDGIGEVYG